MQVEFLAPEFHWWGTLDIIDRIIKQTSILIPTYASVYGKTSFCSIECKMGSPTVLVFFASFSLFWNLGLEFPSNVPQRKSNNLSVFFRVLLFMMMSKGASMG